MLAEIKRKINKDNTNLSERSEDNFTGNFFGAIRYLPNSIGVNNILSATKFYNSSTLDKMLIILSKIDDYGLKYKFWDKTYLNIYGEIDLLIENSDVIIGIEVKYTSGLSSDDDIDNSDIREQQKESSNQLSEYSRMLNDLRNNRDVYLIFLAPNYYGNIVFEDVVRRKIIHENINFGLLTWENIFRKIEIINDNSKEIWQKIVFKDLLDYLTIKGFDKFSGFKVKNKTIISPFYYYYITSFDYKNIIKQIDRRQYYEFKK